MSSRRKFLVSGGMTVAGVLSHIIVNGNPFEPDRVASLLAPDGEQFLNSGEKQKNKLHMHTAPDSIISLPSKFSVGETMNRLEKILTAKGITVFVRINQQAEAKKAGTGAYCPSSCCSSEIRKPVLRSCRQNRLLQSTFP